MRKIISRLTISCFALLMTTTACNSQVVYTEYEPASPGIRIMGRTMVSQDGDVEFDWPGITITANFTGTACAMKMDDTGHNWYNVFLDDQPVRVIEVYSDTTMIIAENLEDQEHSLTITKRTEGFQGKATFKGLLIDSEGSILPHPASHSAKKIEFIGNSITCGYGADSYDRFEDFKPETENNYHSYASIMARAFGAETHIVAHSGQGVVRNYGYEKPVSPYVMPDRYMQVFDMQKEPLWDFSKWQPDLVVINLGTNDFSTHPHPGETVFNKGYMNLIKTVREIYDSVPVFCVVGPMTNEPCYSYVKKMVEANRNFLGDERVYFVGIPTYLMIEEEDLGAGMHPNYPGHIKMAQHVAPVIASVMGWDYGKLE